MTAEIEALKRVHLVDFLMAHYHLEFRGIGGEYVCPSPFTEDKNPSFFVRMVNGHWLFKDFSSGLGGSIFDFVRIKENLERFSEVLSYIRRLVSPMAACSSEGAGSVKVSDGESPLDVESSSPPQRSYDVNRLYDQFKGESVSICRDYLLRRGISKRLVNELIAEDILLHNQHKGDSYCCFAVFNGKRELKCLDNHHVDGPDKFVLGSRSVFTREWDLLPRAETVFICEGIIDYLSMKTLEEDAPPGLALLGNDVSFDPALLGSARQIISALDYDRGGYSALLDLKEQFPQKEIKIYDLEDHKDPNEFLMAIRSFKGRKLSPERKLKIYQEFLQSSNKSELARKWGMDRSYMYDIVRECEKNIVDSFSGRKPGRKPEGKPATLEEACKRIEELENDYEREATERELLYCRSEFLKLRLKWAEIEAAELRGEPVDESKGPGKKTQIKKKKKRRS
ncbi:MAG: toprim domain-containing protein [Pseudomonadota bacterium]